MGDPGPGDEQERAVVRLVRDNLLFLLGLAPVLIAMLRVAIVAQGDYGVVMTLVRTLDVRAFIDRGHLGARHRAAACGVAGNAWMPLLPSVA